MARVHRLLQAGRMSVDPPEATSLPSDLRLRSPALAYCFAAGALLVVVTLLLPGDADQARYGGESSCSC